MNSFKTVMLNYFLASLLDYNYYHHDFGDTFLISTSLTALLVTVKVKYASVVCIKQSRVCNHLLQVKLLS